MKNLRPVHKGVSKSIRLDPLSVQPRDKYRGAEYRMWVYGVPLDWDQVSSLREDLHGRWMPDDPLSIGCSFTDVVWSPRSGEVHFVCEEVPSPDQIYERGSRYLHAIFLPEEGHFIHVDGAVRYYSVDQMDSRLKTHVRKAGKAGQRVKIFRVEGAISTELWSALASSFFVWNQDVVRYVAGQGQFPPI